MLSSKKLTIILLAALIAVLTVNLRLNTVRIKTEYHTISQESLGSVFGGVRIAQITDLHTSKIGTLERQLVEKLQSIKPNLIFITGDFINNDSDIPACSTLAVQISQIAPTIATLGNNDHKTQNRANDTGRLTAILSGLGITLLVNQAALFIHENDSIYIVGLDDDLLLYDNYFKATAGIPKDAPRIVLAHTPEIVEKISREHINFIFCGHTHGGQILLPLTGNLFEYFKFKYLKGLYQTDEYPVNLYVNRGIGTSFIPIRWGSRPEIAVFEFK